MTNAAPHDVTNRTIYLTRAETNKLIRKALRESFPGVKFSVRRSSGSTYVNWTDGPTKAEANAVASKFEAAYFDSMTDYQGSNIHTLAGQEVHFGGNFIFCERHESDGLVRKAGRAYKTMDGHEQHMLICKAPAWAQETSPEGFVSLKPEGLASMISLCVPQPSPTADSVEFLRAY